MTTGSFDVDWERRILQEIANPRIRRAAVTESYTCLLRKSGVDWETINRAIIARWSEAALIWMKTKAWRQMKKEGGLHP